jgi:hypothetical protein
MRKFLTASEMAEPLLVVLICALIRAPISRADPCDSAPEDWLEEIKQNSSSDGVEKLIGPVLCLSQKADYYADHYDEFIKSGVMEKIEAETEKNRLKVIRLLVPLTDSPSRELRQAAVAALAYYRYHPSGDMLDEYPDGAKKAVLYAIVGYRNAMVWAIDEFDFLDRDGDSGDEETIIGQMACLNLLYYLAEPQCLQFIESVMLRHEPLLVRVRAMMVKDRIYQLHPELK